MQPILPKHSASGAAITGLSKSSQITSWAMQVFVKAAMIIVLHDVVDWLLPHLLMFLR